MSCSRIFALVLVGVVVAGAELKVRGWKPILPPGVTSYDSRFDTAPVETPLSSRGSSILGPLESEHSFGQQEHSFGQTGLQHYQNEGGDQCTLYKVNFNQQLYFQYIQYKIGIPDMKEFTLCMWNKFTNHSNDHPLFSYSVANQPRAILSWVSNTARASYYSLSVEGHTFYRLNYPLRLNRWYHSCQSWNSNTGEWQVWVNAERVGRGFHNRLVGHVIPGGGVAITGQEQRQQGGGFLEGAHGPPGAGGFLGEVTMVHLYAAALAPGKAHKDHKHHHGQHNHQATMPPAAPTTPEPPPAFLVGNQLPAALNLNLGNLHLQRPLLPQGVTPSPTLDPLALLANPNQFGAPSFPAQQPHLTLQQHLNQQQLPFNAQIGQQQYGNVGFGNIPTGLKLTGQNGDVIRQSFRGNGAGLSLGIGGFNGLNLLGNNGQRIFKRQEDKEEAKKMAKRSTDAELEKDILKTAATTTKEDKKQTKRGVFFGQQYPSGIGSLSGFGASGQGLNFLQSGTLDLDGNQNGILNAAPAGGEAKDDGYPREAAEGEVIQVMNICSGCAEEPFKQAEIISWRNTPKKLYSGALFLPAKPQCRRF